jgi:hypothetical protein
MEPIVRPLLVEVLEPTVLDFETDLPGFYLRNDLNALDNVRSVDAFEAVVFYAVRIVEVMARTVLRPICTPSDHLAQNLNLLGNHCSLPRSLLRWLHRLRELGNDNRHINRILTMEDADVAFAVVLRWLNWYFCEYSYGPFYSGIVIYNRSLDALLPRKLFDLITQLDHADKAFLASLQLNQPDCELLLTPILPAVLVEVLLSRDRLDEALPILREARAQRRFPRDLRLAQLEGLYYSRLARQKHDPRHLETARRLLESLRPADSAADQETLGIRAGVYKQLSEMNNDDRNWLQRCHETYRQGWERSRNQNNYLGINAAATALWLGDENTAKTIANRVCANLEELTAQLTAAEDGSHAPAFWDQVALAEAYLVLGDDEAVGSRYQDAFARFPQNTAEIALARSQARRTLQCRGQGDRAGKILGE